MKKILILLFIPSVVFLPSLFFGYTRLDDTFLIAEHMSYLADPQNILSFFKSPYLDFYYRPLVIFSFALNAFVSETSLFVFHLTNLLIHLVNVRLIYAVCKKMGFGSTSSFWGALLFAVYPTVVPAVAWVPGRNDLLLMMFLLLTLFTMTSRYFVFSSLFFFLALLGKETAIGYVFVIGLYYIYFKKKKKKTDAFVIVLFGLFVFLYVFMSNAVLAPVRAPVWSYISNFTANIFYYIPIIGEIIFPFNLSFLKNIDDGNVMSGIAAIVLFISFLGIFRIKNKGVFFFGLLLFFFSFVPVFAYLTKAEGFDVYFVANRYYVPLWGVILMILSTRFWERLKAPSKVRLIPWVFVIVLSLLSFSMSFRYKDMLSFWNNETAASPQSFRAHYKYALMLYEEKEYASAITQFKRAEAIQEDARDLHYPVGATYMRLGEEEKALKYFEKALAFAPTDSNLRDQVGLLYYKRGEYTAARFHWEQTLVYEPKRKLVNYNLGILALKVGQKATARKFFEKELSLNPGHKDSLSAIGLTF